MLFLPHKYSHRYSAEIEVAPDFIFEEVFIGFLNAVGVVAEECKRGHVGWHLLHKLDFH